MTERADGNVGNKVVAHRLEHRVRIFRDAARRCWSRHVNGVTQRRGDENTGSARLFRADRSSNTNRPAARIDRLHRERFLHRLAETDGAGGIELFDAAEQESAFAPATRAARLSIIGVVERLDAVDHVLQPLACRPRSPKQYPRR